MNNQVRDDLWLKLAVELSEQRLRQRVSSLLVCPVCNEQVTDPRVLLCGHIYCAECIKLLSPGRQVICSDCNFSTALEEEQPRHQLAASLVNMLKHQSKKRVEKSRKGRKAKADLNSDQQQDISHQSTNSLDEMSKGIADEGSRKQDFVDSSSTSDGLEELAHGLYEANSSDSESSSQQKDYDNSSCSSIPELELQADTPIIVITSPPDDEPTNDALEGIGQEDEESSGGSSDSNNESVEEDECIDRVPEPTEAHVTEPENKGGSVSAEETSDLPYELELSVTNSSDAKKEKTDPVNIDPVNVDPVNVDPVNMDPVNVDSVNASEAGPVIHAGKAENENGSAVEAEEVLPMHLPEVAAIDKMVVEGVVDEESNSNGSSSNTESVEEHDSATAPRAVFDKKEETLMMNNDSEKKEEAETVGRGNATADCSGRCEEMVSIESGPPSNTEKMAEGESSKVHENAKENIYGHLHAVAANTDKVTTDVGKSEEELASFNVLGADAAIKNVTENDSSSSESEDEERAQDHSEAVAVNSCKVTTEKEMAEEEKEPFSIPGEDDALQKEMIEDGCSSSSESKDEQHAYGHSEAVAANSHNGTTEDRLGEEEQEPFSIPGEVTAIDNVIAMDESSKSSESDEAVQAAEVIAASKVAGYKDHSISKSSSESKKSKGNPVPDVKASDHEATAKDKSSNSSDSDDEKEDHTMFPTESVVYSNEVHSSYTEDIIPKANSPQIEAAVEVHIMSSIVNPKTLPEAMEHDRLSSEGGDDYVDKKIYPGMDMVINTDLDDSRSMMSPLSATSERSEDLNTEVLSHSSNSSHNDIQSFIDVKKVSTWDVEQCASHIEMASKDRIFVTKWTYDDKGKILTYNSRGQKVKFLQSGKGNYSGLARSKLGFILALNTTTHRLEEYSGADGSKIKTIKLEQCKDPQAIDIMPSTGQILVVDSERNAVVVYPNKRFGTLRIITHPLMKEPYDIATTADAFVVTCARSKCLLKLDLKGELLWSVGVDIETKGRFAAPQGVCIDESGKIYVTDRKHAILVFTAEGKFIGIVRDAEADELPKPWYASVRNGTMALLFSHNIVKIYEFL